MNVAFLTMSRALRYHQIGFLAGDFFFYLLCLLMVFSKSIFIGKRPVYVRMFWFSIAPFSISTSVSLSTSEVGDSHLMDSKITAQITCNISTFTLFRA